MNDVADKFDGKIIGIDPVAGIMSTTEKAMGEYSLNNFELMEGSGATMTATMQARLKQNEWVAVTGWTPHWKFARWELKYLEDPKGLYGDEEYISTIVRKGLQEDIPEVYAFLDKFKWEPADMEQVMIWNTEEGADPYETAKRWVEENPDKVDAWLK
jgi:glycine betaine/proline transport system substrate-binding protein